MCVPQCQTRCCMCVFIKGAQICSLGDYFQWLAASGAAVKWKRSGQPALRAMFPAFERSRHVSRQLTRWVGVLQRKCGLFPPCLWFLGNVPPSCFHADRITQAWPKLGRAASRLLPALGRLAPTSQRLCPAGERAGCGCLSLGLRRLSPPPAKTSRARWTRTAGVCGRARERGRAGRKEEGTRDTEVPPPLRFFTGQRDPGKTNIKFPNFPTALGISSGSSFWTMRQYRFWTYCLI